MSKKQNNRKKIILKLRLNETYILANSDFFTDLNNMIEEISKTCEDKNLKTRLKNASAFIKNAAMSNEFSPNSNENQWEDYDD